MKQKIGFACDTCDRPSKERLPVVGEPTVPRKSVVQVQFPGRGMTLAYYNDRFDLHVGDFVYVDGKLEGQQGRVAEVNYNFKINLTQYKRVIAVANTAVRGQFCFADSHFVTFDRHALPKEQARTWFMAPTAEDEETVVGNDDTGFRLDDLSGMHVSLTTYERGRDYYADNRVVYLCLDEDRGYAIVNGSAPYEVEFQYRDGEISRLTCTCFCGGRCKHQVAVLLQLRDLLAKIEKDYPEHHNGYCSAVVKSAFFCYAVASKPTGSIVL